MTLRQYLRNWLLAYPKLNPYKYSFQQFFYPLRFITSQLRVLPDFAIVGASRCGTTSLYYNLLEHPNIYPGAHKAAEFFDHNYEKGVNYYQAHFPTKIFKNYITQFQKKKFVTGEATTTYLLESHLAERIAKITPNLKMIAILRNPIDRAYSHFNYYLSRGETKFSTFDEAIKFEEKLLEKNRNKIEFEQNLDKRYYSLLREGIYISPLKILMNRFPKNQFFIIRFEDFVNDSSNILNQVFQFLGVPKFEIKNPQQLNAVDYHDKINPNTREFLIKFFKPYNEALYEYLGRNFEWD